jgi:hypothetical protein
MDARDASWLFIFTAAVQVLTLVFIAARTRLRAPTARTQKEVFDVYSAVAVGPVLSREASGEGSSVDTPGADGAPKTGTAG